MEQGSRLQYARATSRWGWQSLGPGRTKHPLILIIEEWYLSKGSPMEKTLALLSDHPLCILGFKWSVSLASKWGFTPSLGQSAPPPILGCFLVSQAELSLRGRGLSI